MNSVDLGFFYNERKLNALEKYYEGTVEGYIEYQLDILFQEIVPNDEQNAIEELNLREELEAKKSEQENRRFSLNHIRENGKDYYFIDERIKSFYAAADIYRIYSRNEIGENPLVKDTLAETLRPCKVDISKEEYEQLMEKYEDDKHIVAVFDFDLDDGTASAMMYDVYGWNTYMLKDVSTAVFYANRHKYGNSDFKEMKFGEHLEGKEFRELETKEFCESCENDAGNQENNSGMQMC